MATGRGHAVGLAATMVIAGVLLFATLGHSSLFIDEIASWYSAKAPFGELFHRVRVVEVAPPTYYLMLHGVLGLGGVSEAALRLPSALAALALIPVGYWLGWLIGDRRTGLLAAFFTALSPLVLEYGTQARAYVFAMLGSAIAVAALLHAERAKQPAARRLVWLAAISAAVALAFHYTAGLVLVPVAVWLVAGAELGRRLKLTFALPLVLVGMALLPLLADQAARGHHVANALDGDLSVKHAAIVVSGSLSSRAAEPLARPLLAALLVAVVLFVTAVTTRDRRTWLVLGCAAFPMASLFVVTVVYSPYLHNRYAAVATPFVAVLLARLALRLPRPASMATIAAVTALSVTGLWASFGQKGQYHDYKAAAATIREGLRPGDALWTPNGGLVWQAIDYNVYRRTSARPVPLGYTTAALSRARREHRRIWILSVPLSPQQLADVVGQGGYRAIYLHRFVANGTLQLTLVAPAPG
jgi:mannosyltransferase